MFVNIDFIVTPLPPYQAKPLAEESLLIRGPSCRGEGFGARYSVSRLLQVRNLDFLALLWIGWAS